jgi:hypothetical protein
MSTSSYIQTVRLHALVLAASVMAGGILEAAQNFEFANRVAGAYPRSEAGRVTIDGDKWRIDYAPAETGVIVFNSLLGVDGKTIALNHSERTWFWLKTRTLLQIEASLFAYGMAANETTRVRVERARAVDEADGRTKWSVPFAYVLHTRISGEKIQGRVWGEVRVWTAAGPTVALPWQPLDLSTGLPDVDVAFERAFAPFAGLSVTTCEVDVSRQLERGAIMQLQIRRSRGEIARGALTPGVFDVPRGYRYEEPRIGAPGR